ncbi:MAG: DUF1638 domain-containing protein [Sedimentisphaerales bacterium]|nr:DUF1638 domain-containing protein [Sedimentisphaerales bacterium]
MIEEGPTIRSDITPTNSLPRRFQLIVCKVLQREAYFCAARSRHVVDVVLMEQGLHNEPDRLRREVQKALARTRDIQGRRYDASLLGYGLCSNGTVGLSAEIPIVIPRGHDCITLLLGSRQRYQEYFDSHRGVYWYSPGWIEAGDQPSRERYEHLLAEYTGKYGADNAQYLMEVEQTWTKEYRWAAFVDWGLIDSETYKAYTKECAAFLGWDYDELRGDPGLMQRFVDGVWNKSEFLVVAPGGRIAEDVTNEGIIRAE